jgi:hypothetical protein
MWKFEQATGRLFSQSGTCVAQGYSGFGKGRNNPALQSVEGIGPCPVGFYHIGEPVDTETLGQFVLRLEPFKENQMFGRTGFLIHGDSVKSPGTASHGCLIFSRPVRELVWESGDHQLEVVARVTL